MTNIGAGIDDAVEVLADTSNGRIAAQPIMVVMTDGRHNQSRDPLDAARDALWLLPNLEIHTVTFSVHADQKMDDRTGAGGARSASSRQQLG